MELTQKIENLEKIAFVLKTIAHPLRYGIVELLVDHEKLSVGEICEKLQSEQSLTSHHLTNMKLKGLLKSSRDGKNIYYSLKMKDIEKIIGCIQKCDLLE